MQTNANSDVVELLGGLIVPVEALRLFLDLEDRGLGLRAEGDKLRILGVNERTTLSPSEVTAIKRWKQHLLALVVYAPPKQ